MSSAAFLSTGSLIVCAWNTACDPRTCCQGGGRHARGKKAAICCRVILLRCCSSAHEHQPTASRYARHRARRVRTQSRSFRSIASNEETPPTEVEPAAILRSDQWRGPLRAPLATVAAAELDQRP